MRKTFGVTQVLQDAGGDKKIVAWGTGNVLREFLYVEDAAEGILLAAEHYDKPEPGNLASGKEITIL